MDCARPVPITLRTFADYGVEFGWFAHCTRCVRDRHFSQVEIDERFGLDADVDAVRRSLRCGRCGQQDCLLYRYFRGGMNGPGEASYL